MCAHHRVLQNIPICLEKNALLSVRRTFSLTQVVAASAAPSTTLASRRRSSATNRLRMVAMVATTVLIAMALFRAKRRVQTVDQK